MSDALSAECMQNAVDVVNTINIDFAKLAAEAQLTISRKLGNNESVDKINKKV